MRFLQFGPTIAPGVNKLQAKEPCALWFLTEEFMVHERKSGQTSNTLEGRYANYFKIGHNAFELIIDCGQCYAEDDQPQLHTRIITSPAYGKSLLKILRDCLNEYENVYGQIGE